MRDSDIVIVFVGVASYLAAVVQGVTTFGDAIVMHLLWRVAVLLAPDVMAATPFGEDHLVAVTMLLTVRSIGVQAAFAWQSREYFCWSLVQVALPAQLLALPLGAILLVFFQHTEWLGPVVGGSLILCAAVFIAANAYTTVQQASCSSGTSSRGSNASPPPAGGAGRSSASLASGTTAILPSHSQASVTTATTSGTTALSSSIAANRQRTTMEHMEAVRKELLRNPRAAIAAFEVTTTMKVGIVAGFAVGGLLAGLVGVGGPPLMVVSLLLKLPQPVLRGTFPFVTLAAYVVRVLLSLVLGMFNPAAWMLYISVVVGALAGLFVGIEIGAQLPHDLFVFAVGWLILFGGVAIAGVNGWVILGSFIACGLSLAVVLVARQRSQAVALPTLLPSPPPPLPPAAPALHKNGSGCGGDDEGRAAVVVVTATKDRPEINNDDDAIHAVDIEVVKQRRRPNHPHAAVVFVLPTSDATSVTSDEAPSCGRSDLPSPHRSGGVVRRCGEGEGGAVADSLPALEEDVRDDDSTNRMTLAHSPPQTLADAPSLLVGPEIATPRPQPIQAWNAAAMLPPIGATISASDLAEMEHYQLQQQQHHQKDEEETHHHALLPGPASAAAAAASKNEEEPSGSFPPSECAVDSVQVQQSPPATQEGNE